MIRAGERSRSEEAITEGLFRPDTVHSNAQPGVKLGTTTANHTQIYSGGGNISIKGSSTATGLVDDRDEAGIYQWGRMTMKSGLGSIVFNGTSSEYQGIGFVVPVSETDTGTKQLIMSFAKTSGHGDFADRILGAEPEYPSTTKTPRKSSRSEAVRSKLRGPGSGRTDLAAEPGRPVQAGSILLYGGTEGIVLRDRGARFEVAQGLR